MVEVLSEHLCEGWLEGYLLTGRHGLFNSYEAFIHIIDSMFNQHAKWLKVTRGIPWRRPIASLNYLLSSHVWRQDHNGFSHQDPGFIDHVVNKKAEIIRVYLPPDANCLLSVYDHCLRSRDYVNVVVAGKQPALDYLSIDEAIAHCTRGVGIWEWASNDAGGEPDVVLACCGDVPTLETLAAAALLREALPELKVRVVNVVDLMRLQQATEHPHGLSGQRVRRDLHHEQASRLRLPRLSVVDPSPHLPARQPRQPACARLQGGGHHHDAVRHGDAERPRPLPPRDGRDRPRAGPCRTRQARYARSSRTAPARPRLHARARRGRSGDRRLDVAGLILVVNAGSTSLKLSAVAADDSAEAVDSLAEAPPVEAVAHRVVHGGARFRDPVRIDDEVRQELQGLAELAPLHMAPALAAIDEARRALPDVPHVAVFDTAFHATLPPEAYTYGLPRRWREDWGIRRYGFHGLSVAWSAERVPVPRLVVCHLGGGCSVTAVLDGRSVDTTMGFSPLEGVPMATRPGAIDAEILLYLLRHGYTTADELEHELEHESGLLALGGSARVEELEASTAPEARLALAVFGHQVAGAVARMAASLGGLDAIVFTAGVGEGSARVRSDICARLGFLGVKLDPERNDAAVPDSDLATEDAAVRVWVVRAREDIVAARAARKALGCRPGPC